MAALNTHQKDPVDLFDEAAARRHLFGARPWMEAVLAWSSGEEAIGLAAWYPSYEPCYAAPGAYVTALWVEPEWRRRGVAGALLGAVADRVVAVGGEYLWWATKPWNAEARTAYAALGAFEDNSRLHILVRDAFAGIRNRTVTGPAAPKPEETPAP